MAFDSFKSIAEVVTEYQITAIDPELEAIIPDLIALNTETCTQLLLQFSREAIVRHFQDSRV
jgi:hypothetical protein